MGQSSSGRQFPQSKRGKLRYVYVDGILYSQLLIFIQEHLPPGATRIGIMLASDGTQLTNGTGDNEAHPVRAWFISYAKAVALAMSDVPGIDIQTHSTIFKAMETAAPCATCRGKVFNQLPTFLSSHLVPEIHKAMDAVRFIDSQCLPLNDPSFRWF